MKHIRIISLILAIFIVPSCASKSEFEKLQEQLEDLKDEISSEMLCGANC